MRVFFCSCLLCVYTYLLRCLDKAQELAPLMLAHPSLTFASLHEAGTGQFASARVVLVRYLCTLMSFSGRQGSGVAVSVTVYVQEADWHGQRVVSGQGGQRFTDETV